MDHSHPHTRCQNTIADTKSRLKHSDKLEWALNPKQFTRATEVLNWYPGVDLFASRLNYKLKPFYSLRADPEACGCDAFNVSWRYEKCYAFPPFPLTLRVLRKVQTDEAMGMIGVPDWPTRPWYPVLMNMVVSDRFSLPRSQWTLTNLAHEESHPLSRTMTMAAYLISGVRKPRLIRRSGAADPQLMD